MTSSRNKSSYRSSLNDATSLEISRVADDFDRALFRPIENSSTHRLEQDLLPFPTTPLAPATSETKITSEDDEEQGGLEQLQDVEEEEDEDSVANAVIPLVEEAEGAMGEALQLYDFGQRDERDGHHHHLHHHHHHHHHKQHHGNGKECSREVRDGGSASDENDNDDESRQPEMRNVKKETSV